MNLKLQEECSKLNNEKKSLIDRLGTVRNIFRDSPIMELGSGLILKMEMDDNAQIHIKISRKNTYGECLFLLEEIDNLILSLKNAKIIGNMSEDDIITYGKTENIIKKITEMEMKK